MKIYLLASGYVTYMKKVVIIITAVIDCYNITLPLRDAALKHHPRYSPLFHLPGVYKLQVCL